MNTNQHSNSQHNTHHSQTVTPTSTSYSKLPTTYSGSNSQYNTNAYKSVRNSERNAAFSSFDSANKTNSKDITVSSTTNVNNIWGGLTSSTSTVTSTSPTSTASSYKFAPARRLAARQTLRLAIPKQPGDSQHSHFNSTANTTGPNSNSTQFKNSSPSQLPPAPIFKRTSVNTSPFSYTPSSTSFNSHIPKSPSPLESHHLPNVIHHTTPVCTVTPSITGSNKFLRVRNPNITLNSSDACSGSTNLFAFAKEFSSPTVVAGAGEHSPIFVEIASSMSPSTGSSGSPTNQLSRLFNLSPSAIRSYGNQRSITNPSF